MKPPWPTRPSWFRPRWARSTPPANSVCIATPKNMKLIINGEERLLENVSSLTSLLQQLGLKSDRVAIELNREIVARGVWESIALKDGDRLEIVQFVGGGCCCCAQGETRLLRNRKP